MPPARLDCVYGSEAPLAIVVTERAAGWVHPPLGLFGGPQTSSTVRDPCSHWPCCFLPGVSSPYDCLIDGAV